VAMLRNHWHWRPEWRGDRPRYWWYLTFADHSALHDLARSFQGHVGGVDCLDVIPVQWLHLTIQDIAFLHEIGPGEVSALGDAAVEAVADLPTLRLSLGPVRTTNSAVVLEARPTDRLSAVRDRLRRAIAEVRGPEQVPGPVEFRPHVSLAYVNRDCDASDALDPLLGVPMLMVQVTVTKVTLAAVTRGNRAYRWEVATEVPLGGVGWAARCMPAPSR
jgi:2'-5' RNA ligase